MAKNRDEKQNSGTPGEGEFSLEEILAEFGHGRAKRAGQKEEAEVPEDTIPFPVVRPKGREAPRAGGAGKVLRFPQGERGPAPAPPPQPPEPEKETAEEPSAAGGEPEEDKVVAFPGEEESANPIAEGLSRLVQKADAYAEHMFEEEDAENDEEVRRAERYIPGTDQEEEPEEDWRERRRRRQPPPAPDLSPADLARRYRKGLKGLRVRGILVLLLALAALYVTLAPGLNLPAPSVLSQSAQLRCYALAAAQLIAMLLGADVLARGLFSLFRLEFGMDTLLVFSCAAALADACTLLRLDTREGQMPYCALVMLAIFFTMRGTWLRRRGQWVACRTAASASEPYLVTLDEGKWNARGTYTKWSGSTAGFGSQMQAPDGAQRLFRVVCPLLFVACLVLSGLASVGRGRPEDLLWCLSATLTAACAFSSALCFGKPWHSLSVRLSRSGAALAGWDAVTGTSGGSGILLTDTDLFPPGCVSLNGIKIFGDFPAERVVAYAATLIRSSGSGLDKLFHDLLRTQGAIYRRVDRVQSHEGGGLSGEIRGEQVLVGSAAFMHLMEIPLPQGLNVKNAVFCAVNGELAGIFALRYVLHGAIEPSLHALIRNRVVPVLATRDFNLIPAMLRQRFKLPVEKMEYPPVERRAELSDPEQEHSEILTAVLCREGLGPYSEAVVGGQRLYRAVRMSACLACVGAAVGVLLAFYLTSAAAYASLSPANLLIFLLMWLVPAPLISGWVNKY